MRYIDNPEFFDHIKRLVGKKILFKLTDDEDDKGLIGTLKQYNDNLIIEREKIDIIIEVSDLYFIEEYK